jgi:uncharacterized protein (DUF1501 family)
MVSLNRRAFLAASVALGFVPAARAAPVSDRRLIFIVLRGAMDGLHAVPPLGDPDYQAARGGLALKAEGGALRLDSTFALHPALAPLSPLWQARELAVIHAAASPYRERSHFDGQDVLESGAAKPHALADGWLNRAVAALGHPPALAVAQALPLVLRGEAKATSWAPSPLPGLAPDRIAALRALYAGDALLASAFEEGVQMEAFADEALAGDDAMMEGGKKRKGGNAFPLLAGAAGTLMAAPDGPRVVVMELGGWDTHSGQLGRMAQPLGQLAQGIAALAKSLGPAWRTTMVVAASEFGRTVAENGTNGSDHGTGGAMILAGGALAGGKVVADWPGLAKAGLYQNRDLRPTTDDRAVFKAVLHDHMGVAAKALDQTVFPDSAAVKPLQGLVRA